MAGFDLFGYARTGPDVLYIVVNTAIGQSLVADSVLHCTLTAFLVNQRWRFEREAGFSKCGWVAGLLVHLQISCRVKNGADLALTYRIHPYISLTDLQSVHRIRYWRMPNDVFGNVWEFRYYYDDRKMVLK